MNTIFTIGIFLCFFLLLLLLSRKDKTTSDKILAVWIFIFGMNLFLSCFLYPMGYLHEYPVIAGINHPLPLFHGPMLYLYVLFSLRTGQHFGWKIFLHFIPAIACWIYLMKFFIFYTPVQQGMVFSGELNNYTPFLRISLTAFVISGIIYPIISSRLLKQHQMLLPENISLEKSAKLIWLKYCVWVTGSVYMFAAIVITLHHSLGDELGVDIYMSMYVLIILFIFSMGFLGIRNQHVFGPDSEADDKITGPQSAGEYEKSGLKEEDALVYHQKLMELMTVQKPYLEPKLTLGKLADEIEISANHLSQVINQYEEKNFFDFVNTYRVEEFKRRALDPANSNFSILAIAMDSGFNSKSSFNHVFKKMVGKTPSQYLAQE